MNSIRIFLVVAILFFATLLVLQTQYKKTQVYHDKYECIYEDQLNLLEFNKSLINKIDSLQVTLDSLQNRYKIFDTEPARDFIDIMNAIMHVESSGNADAYNPSEDAVGILQIRQCMVDDINRILKRKNQSHFYSYDDRWCTIKSSEMFKIFCEYYNLTTAEEMARCWNGGPRGINNPYTLGYWNKVEIELEEGYASR